MGCCPLVWKVPMVVPGLDGMWHLGCHFLPSCPSPCGDPQSGGVLVLSFSARTEGPWLPGASPHSCQLSGPCPTPQLPGLHLPSTTTPARGHAAAHAQPTRRPTGNDANGAHGANCPFLLLLQPQAQSQLVISAVSSAESSSRTARACPAMHAHT